MSDGQGAEQAPTAALAELLALAAGAPALLLGLAEGGRVASSAGASPARGLLPPGAALPPATWEALLAGHRAELELGGRRYALTTAEPAPGGLRWAVLLPVAPALTLGRFAQHLVHALRNSLSSVKLTAQTLARQPNLPEREQRRLAIALREVRRMERTLTTASEFARTPTRALEAVALGPLLQAAAQALAEELAARSVQLALVGAEQGLAVEGDPLRLRAAVENLLLCAANSMPDGGEVQARLEPWGEGALLLVEDRGPGLGEGEAEALFSPLGSPRGGGLDLALAEQVAREQGGSLTAEGREGGGLRLRLQLARRGGVRGHAAAGR